MSAGSSFYLVCSFKVAGGNGFPDSLSGLSQRAITDTQIVSLSLSFLAHRVTRFIQLSARMVTTKSQLLLMFLLLCQSRLAKICMIATLVSLETRQASYKSHLQERSCFFPHSTLHTRHVRVLFGLRGKSFSLITDTPIPARRPDLVGIFIKKRICHLVDFPHSNRP